MSGFLTHVRNMAALNLRHSKTTRLLKAGANGAETGEYIRPLVGLPVAGLAL